MTALKIGDRIADNDPRMVGRVLVVERFLNDERTTVVCKRAGSSHYAVKVRVSRIHTDGKPRRSGFSLLKAAEFSLTAAASSGTQSPAESERHTNQTKTSSRGGGVAGEPRGGET